MAPINGFKGFKFGCDPEFFIFKDGKPIPAVGLLPGTKDAPHKVPGGAIQVDGLAGEINIDPVEDYFSFTAGLDMVIAEVIKTLGPGLEIKWVPSVTFGKEEFDAVDEGAKQLGCDPDFDAWTGLINPPPTPKNPLMRCAGGHVHIGWRKDGPLEDDQHMMNCRDLSKQLDWYLAHWALKKDKDKNRRQTYGRAGAFRPKPYGCEYRTLSNFWVSTNSLRLEVWDRMQTAIYDIQSRFLPDKNDDWNQRLTKAINNSKPDKELENTFYYPLCEVR